jgi:preprotein translocase subunit SecE
MAVNGKVKVNDSTNKRGLISFFKELKAEFKRITWASKKDTKKATIAVLSFCVFYIILVGLLDTGFNNIFGLIFK